MITMNTFIKSHRLSLIANNSGILLIEVIISSGIAGILMLSLLAMMQLVNQNSSRVSLGITKNEIITKIRTNSALLQNLESSARMTQTLGVTGLTPNIGTPNNLTNFASLANCIPSVNNAGTCDKTNMDDSKGFRFYLSNGISEDPAKAVAGEDVFYTLSGIRCSQTQAAVPGDCPITAQAWAEPFCSNFANTCNKAISLTVRYRLALRSDFVGTALMAPIEGEIYIPLTKGIQLSRLLSENDTPISMNSSGIYTVQKFYGHSFQSIQPKGLRFEAVLGNPTGLSYMKLQVRKLTGTDANGFLDNVIPSSLTSINTWDDVVDPSGSGAWSVSLTGAKANQIINFGTQTNATTNNNTNKFFKIGTVSGAADQATFFWTYNTSTSQFVAPTFKSGFYQFRVVAVDSANNEIESMNYITVRIVPIPELKRVQDLPNQPNLTQERVCISGQDSINYNIAILDDEGIGTQTLTLAGAGAVSFSAVSGTGGMITVPFNLSQVAGTYNYTFTARNKFYGSTINGYTMAESSNNFGVTLSEVPLVGPDISVNPAIIKITNSGNVTSRVMAGSCCNVSESDITATWRQFGGYLSNPTTPTAVTCSLDTTSKRRTCEANVNVTGINETSAVPATNFESKIDFGSGNTACTGTKIIQPAIRVVRIPNIHFYLNESLWLNIPGNPIYSLKSSVPKVYIEIDFDPEQNVGVEVYKTSDNQTVCTVSFPSGTKTYPTQIACNLPSNYSGKLALRRSTANVQHSTDAPSPTYYAKINSDSSKSEHTTCSANLSAITAFPATLNISSTHPMYNSPYGFDASNVQDPYNDFGLWSSGDTKTLKCYDNWRDDSSGNQYSAITITGTCGTQLQVTSNGIFPSGSYPDYIQQDAYYMHKFQNASKPYYWYCPTSFARSLGNSSYSSSNLRFSTYIFPDSNAYYSTDFDPPNAPYAFVVWNGGAPGGAIWQYNGGTGASTITPPRTWTDYTSQVCTGSAALTKIKLFGTKASGHATAETVMKANNNVYTQAGSGFYNYFFMCSYGRWNPRSKTFSTWTN